MEKRVLTAGCVLAFAFCAHGSSAAENARRAMGVTQGPDTVLERPVNEVLPALNDAKPTGLNGRVGNELVFWGYELADGRHVELFGCALVPNVDCEERVQKICPSRTSVLETRETTGKVVRRSCQAVGVGAVAANAPPGCNDHLSDLEILVGLVDCG